MFFFLLASDAEKFVDQLMTDEVEVAQVYHQIKKEKYTKFHGGFSSEGVFFQGALQKSFHLLNLEMGLMKEEELSPYLGLNLGEEYFIGIDMSYFEKIISFMGKAGYIFPLGEKIALILTFRYHKDNKFVFTLGCSL